MSDIAAVSDVEQDTEDADGEPLLSVRNLKKHYSITQGLLRKEVGRVRAVDGISFDVARGETVGLVGESGCGKSTAATSLLRIEEPTSGEVVFDGDNILDYSGNELRKFRRRAQMIFQDPTSSFDPRMTIGQSVAEPLVIHGITDRDRRRRIVKELLQRVGMSADDIDRYPHEFSGGQKQRVALARAMVVNPSLIVADEPTSALDVSIQSDILRLMRELQDDYGLSIVFISHDLGVIREICDRVAVMYLGEIVEVAETEALFENPQHPYTRALLSSIPTPDPRDRGATSRLKGDVADPSDPPPGCRFHTRCPEVIQPEGYDFEQEQYQNIMSFREQLRKGGVDIEAAKEFAVSEYDLEESDVGDAEVERALKEEFDLPQSLTDSAADSVLSEAFDHVLEEDFATAEGLLEEKFQSVCERRTPTHLRRGDYRIETEEWNAILRLYTQSAADALDVDELGVSGDDPDQQRRAFREQVGLRESLSDADAEETVARAIDALLERRQARASTILYEAFSEPHSSACHLNDDTVTASTEASLGETIATDD